LVDISGDSYTAPSSLSLGYSVVKKISDSIRYDTDMILADVNLGIGDPMQSVANYHLSIEPLDIDRHKNLHPMVKRQPMLGQGED
jgi:hypothetical protein